MTNSKREVRIYSCPCEVESSLGCNMVRVDFAGYDLETGAQVSNGVTEVAFEPSTPAEVQRAVGYNLPIVYMYYAWEASLTRGSLVKLRPYIIRPEDQNAIIAMITARSPGRFITLLTLPDIVARLRKNSY